MPKQQKAGRGGARKIGRNEVKCRRYRDQGRREKNKARKIERRKRKLLKLKQKRLENEVWETQ